MSSPTKTSRTPRHRSRKRRYGRKLHRAQLELERLRHLVASLDAEVHRLESRPAGLWARLCRWLRGGSGASGCASVS